MGEIVRCARLDQRAADFMFMRIRDCNNAHLIANTRNSSLRFDQSALASLQRSPGSKRTVRLEPAKVNLNTQGSRSVSLSVPFIFTFIAAKSLATVSFCTMGIAIVLDPVPGMALPSPDARPTNDAMTSSGAKSSCCDDSNGKSYNVGVCHFKTTWDCGGPGGFLPAPCAITNAGITANAEITTQQIPFLRFMLHLPLPGSE